MGFITSKEKHNMENKELTVNQTNQLTTTSFEDFKSLDDMLAFGEKICKSDLSPLKRKEDVVAALLMGKELGMGVMTSINNIYPINGKASSGIHIIAAQLLKAGISYNVIVDYEPVFAIAIKGSQVANEKGEMKDTYITVKKEPYSYELKEGESRGKTVIDMVTIIKFNRVLKQPNGTYIPMEIISKFYKTDIPEVLAKKDNWKNYENIMMYSRCFTNGAKRIGDDVILGLYETSELADANNIPYKVEDGVATIIDSNPKQKEKTGNPESSITEAVIESNTPNA